MNFDLHIVLSLISVIGFKAALHDFKTFKIPNRYTSTIFLLFVYFSSRTSFPNSMGIYLGIVGSHFLVSVIFPNKFGMGDSKFIAALGLGFATTASFVVWLYASYLLGSIHGLWRKFRSKDSRIPFGVSIYAAWLPIYMGEYVHVALDYSW